MKVFVSWSGQKSKDVAEIFRDWLPSVLHAVKPFVSARDIQAGTRWGTEIAAELDDTDFGLICVTRANLTAEWLNFEAGALAKSVDSSRVVPVAIDLGPADIPNPLGQFQAIRLEEDDLADLLISMNESCADPISEANVRKALGKWWPDLDEELARVRQHNYETPDGPEHSPRSERELLEEVLESVRAANRAGEQPSRRGQDRDAVSELLETALRDEGVMSWSMALAGKRRDIELPSTPSARLLTLAEHIEKDFGVEIIFHSRDG